MLTTSRRVPVWVALLLATATLGACAVPGPDTVDLTSESISKMACDRARDVSVQIIALDEAEAPGRRNQLSRWGLDPGDEQQVSDALNMLDDRITTACAEPSAPSASASPTEAASPSGSPTASPSKTATEKPGDGTIKAREEATATITDNDGEERKLPLVRDLPEADNDGPSVDTSEDESTPPTVTSDVCPVIEGWDELVSCVEDNDLDWYIDGVNQRSGDTGFDWKDVKRWAKATTLSGKAVEARVIEIYGGGISKADARKRAAELVGDELAKQLPVVKHQRCFANTRGLEEGQMDDFVYCPPAERQVRVSLAPLRMDGRGHAVGYLDTDSGIFVDCLNVHWIPPKVKTPGAPPQVNPPPHDNPPHTPPECPPGQVGTPPKCLEPKSDDPSDYVVEQGAPLAQASGSGSKPPKVKQQQSGGHGTTDSATNPPGSESGAQAPGADPAPSAPPTVPPEEGANDPSDGDSSCAPPPGMTSC